MISIAIPLVALSIHMLPLITARNINIKNSCKFGLTLSIDAQGTSAGDCSVLAAGGDLSFASTKWSSRVTAGVSRDTW